MVVNSIFSYFHNVFDHSRNKFQFLRHIYFACLIWDCVNVFCPVKGKFLNPCEIGTDFFFQAYCEIVSSDLNKMNQTVEDAVKELANIFTHKAQVNLAPIEEQTIRSTGSSCKQFCVLIIVLLLPLI